MKNTTIHGSKIRAALVSDLTRLGKYSRHRITRVWCDDGSLHLVIGYQANTLRENPSFDTVVGYWEIPEGECYLSPACREIITRPSFLN